MNDSQKIVFKMTLNNLEKAIPRKEILSGGRSWIA